MDLALQYKLDDFLIGTRDMKPEVRRRETLLFLKNYHQEEDQRIYQAHQDGAKGLEVLNRYSDQIDILIQTIYRLAFRELKEQGKDIEPVAILACGGYGRREMSPYSDIDINFLFADELTDSMGELATQILHYLWDMGFDLGHSLRSIKDCLAFAQEDLASQTSIMESRLVIGEASLFEQLKTNLNETIIRIRMNSYIKGKYHEMEDRHQHYGDSIYHLEPNLKNGVGGLRDIQTALWIAQARFGVHNLSELEEIGVISELESLEIRTTLDFLWRIRNDLHFTARRKQDILSFQYQPLVAEHLGFHEDVSGDPIEHLMQEFYRTARNIKEYSQIIINRCFPPSAKRSMYQNSHMQITPGLYQMDGAIQFDEAGTVKIDPTLILRAFHEIQRRNVRLSIQAKTILRKKIKLIESEEFLNSEAREIFLDMLMERGNLNLALHEMHELGVLEKLIPEFAGLNCLVRHDLQHRYTVDEHTLRLVMYLQQLKNQTVLEKDVDQPPPKELIRVYEKANAHRVLMLTALLHDIGKVAKHKHVDAGLLMIPAILDRLRLSDDDKEKIINLVRIHHMMSEVAQHHDLDDRRVLLNFADHVQTVEMLKLLYCITYADMRSVSPEVWTPWKAILLSELYHKVRAILRGEPALDEDEKQHLLEVQQIIQERFGNEIQPDELERHFSGMSPRYLLGTEPGIICKHIQALRVLFSKPLTLGWQTNGEPHNILAKEYPLITTIDHQPHLRYSNFTVLTLDMPGLFSKIAGTLASKGISINGAQIFTRNDGIVIDTFQLDHQSPGWADDEFIWEEIQEELQKVLVGEKDISAIINARQKSAIIKSAPGVGTKINISTEISDTQTVIDVRTGDRIGLLYTLTSTLSQLGLSITTARIATYGPRAVDVFYVTDIDGKKVTDPDRLQRIQSRLETVLE